VLANSLALLALLAPEPEVRHIDLAVGDQVSIPMTGVAKYTDPDLKIVDVLLPRKGPQSVLVLAGLVPGETTMLFFMKDDKQIRYDISVHPREVAGAVRSRANIRLDFYFVQLSNDNSYSIGIGWPGTIGGTAQVNIIGDLSSGEIAQATASIAAEALPRVDLAQSNGWVRILRQATLVVTSGDQGTFSSGGELNYLVEGKLATGIQSIHYGTDVQIKPRYDVRNGRTELALTADVSDLTESSNNLPGRTISRVETVVNLEIGQAIVLAGLHARTDARTRTGLPLLSQIPIIGTLFGTHSGRNQEVENLLFIVPTIVEPMAPDKRNLVDEALRAYWDYSGVHGDVQKVLRTGPLREAQGGSR
jgi:pilus assembly protein CpaC